MDPRFDAVQRQVRSCPGARLQPLPAAASRFDRRAAALFAELVPGACRAEDSRHAREPHPARSASARDVTPGECYAAALARVYPTGPQDSLTISELSFA